MRGYSSGSTDIVYLWLDCSRQRKQEGHEWKVSCSSRWKIKNRTEGEFVDSLWTLLFILLLVEREKCIIKIVSRQLRTLLPVNSSLWIICYILIVFIYNSTVLLLLLYLSICDFDTTSILSIIGRLLFDFSSVFYTLLQIHLGIYLGKRIWMIVRLRKS